MFIVCPLCPLKLQVQALRTITEEYGNETEIPMQIRARKNKKKIKLLSSPTVRDSHKRIRGMGRSSGGGEKGPRPPGSLLTPV